MSTSIYTKLNEVFDLDYIPTEIEELNDIPDDAVMVTKSGSGWWDTHAMSDEHKKNLSKSLKGRVLSEEHRKNMSLAHKGRKGRPQTEETKRKMREAHKKRLDKKKGHRPLEERHP